MYELFNKYSVVVVRLIPSLPRRGRHPRGNPLDPRIVQNFQLTSLPSEGPMRRPSDPPWGGNTRKILKTSFVNRWFELNVKKLFEMLEFIQSSRISTEPKFHTYHPVCPFFFLDDLPDHGSCITGRIPLNSSVRR